MEKFSASNLLGRADALVKLGFSNTQVTNELLRQGMTKEAVGWIGAALRGAGHLAGKLGGRYGGRAIAAGARQGGNLGGAMQWGGRQMIGAGKATGQAMKGLRTAPGSTLWGGAKNFGSGAMTMQGKGLGGALGKGAFGLSAYNMLSGLGQPQMPQAYGGSMVRPYGQ